MTLTIKDYPLAEMRPDLVRGQRSKPLEDLTLDAVLNGHVTMDDLAITATALRQQAEIADDATRVTLAQNFKRAAELTNVPQDVIMRTYELLRPGRAGTARVLLDAADDFKNKYNAPLMAAFLTEAAEVYESRGLFKKRY
jgi:propanediol dehydratase small subunit